MSRAPCQRSKISNDTTTQLSLPAPSYECEMADYFRTPLDRHSGVA
jgi:hypothetical protein